MMKFLADGWNPWLIGNPDEQRFAEVLYDIYNKALCAYLLCIVIIIETNSSTSMISSLWVLKQCSKQEKDICDIYSTWSGGG